MLQTKTSTGNVENARPVRLGLNLTPSSTIALTSPPWINSVVQRIDHLLGLPDNWDREGALPLQYEIAMDALSFLLERVYHETPAPQIVPTVTGGLQLEWHTGGCDLEIVFAVDLRPTFYYVAADGCEIEGDAMRKEAIIADLIRRLPPRNEHTLFER